MLHFSRSNASGIGAGSLALWRTDEMPSPERDSMNETPPISNLDSLRSWWLAQQLQQQRGLSPQLWLQLQALQQAVNHHYRQDPLSMPTSPRTPPMMTLQQQLQAFTQHNPTLPFTERFTPSDRRADAFAGSPLDTKSRHLPSLDELAPLW